jgi:serine/threonine protein phosphatase 1
MKVAQVAKNPNGRDLIVGDIHGCFDRLREALARAHFNPGKDRLFSVGDLVDRGPQSVQALDWIAKPWFCAVRGNHEQMTLDAHLSTEAAMHHVMNGGAWFNALTKPEKTAVRDVLNMLPIAIELETDGGTVLIVHAECPRGTWKDTKDALADPGVSEACVWSRYRINQDETESVPDVRAVVCGHTPNDKVVRSGNHVWIDTMGWLRGHFTILDAKTLEPA